MPVEKRPIGGWRAQDFGLQPGKAIETRVFENKKTETGSTWLMFEIFKPFQSRRPEDAGQFKKSFSFPIKAIPEIVARLNHIQNLFGDQKGQWVFQPQQVNYGQQYSQGPQQYPPQQQGYQPQHGAPGNVGGYQGQVAGQGYVQPQQPAPQNPPQPQQSKLQDDWY